ncbi:MAG TPA: DRTGG domain-containing protein [Syntrophales bacterium]|nr:DRTGG domain-containing protein [Syntrophales bacterium]HOM06919.1 DRTGG domain-containing protein [Syntrophales bacterium]HON98781.1 DRTGG domain-containing protein [Syntrophales bacterium]HPC00959.1 DRTGG domain-containing protein [Syntrophales bacterium]HPQ06460.1 DRTGG domain-containing protein [Syntrophales bacterium]
MATLGEIVAALDLKVRSGEDKMGTEVHGGYTGDLLSDVMAGSKEGDLWITRQTHQNIVAVASLKDHAGIILAGGAEPAADTLEKAKREGIPILVSNRSAFETAGMLFEMISSQKTGRSG